MRAIPKKLRQSKRKKLKRTQPPKKSLPENKNRNQNANTTKPVNTNINQPAPQNNETTTMPTPPQEAPVSFIWPVSNDIKALYFFGEEIGGFTIKGIDFAAPIGTPISA